MADPGGFLGFCGTPLFVVLRACVDSFFCPIGVRLIHCSNITTSLLSFPLSLLSPSLSLSSPDSLGDSAVLRIPHSGLPLQPHQPLWEGLPHTSTETVCQGKAVEREEGGGREGGGREREKREGGMKIHSPSEAVSHGRVIGRNWLIYKFDKSVGCGEYSYVCVHGHSSPFPSLPPSPSSLLPFLSFPATSRQEADQVHVNLQYFSRMFKYSGIEGLVKLGR